MPPSAPPGRCRARQKVHGLIHYLKWTGAHRPTAKRATVVFSPIIGQSPALYETKSIDGRSIINGPTGINRPLLLRAR